MRSEKERVDIGIAVSQGRLSLKDVGSERLRTDRKERHSGLRTQLGPGEVERNGRSRHSRCQVSENRELFNEHASSISQMERLRGTRTF